ncbi:pantoate--beta-alanine ligase [Actinomyces sp.]
MNPKPQLTHTREELAAALSALEGSVALVMTMGALHRGHLELVRQAHELADHVVVTIFVNPTQFAPGEDYDAYPRTLDADMEALSTVGADVVWAPSNDDAYPVPATTRIDAGPVAHILEGATRPTHFAGVALVVTKALNLIRPEVALFGQKDAQQLAVIRTFVRDLDIPVRIQGVEIVRDSDGVALSSRNQYLSDAEREHARALSRAIDEARAAAALGVPVSEVLRAAQQVLDAEEGVEPDYVAIVDDDDFTLLAGSGSAADQVNTELRCASFERWAAQGTMRARILLAARVGATRLIDNADVMVSVSGDAR